MAVTHSAGGTTITGPHIAIAQMMTWKASIGLEAKGMTRRGVSMKTIACQQLGISTRTSHEAVIAQLQEKIDAALKAAQQ